MVPSGSRCGWGEYRSVGGRETSLRRERTWGNRRDRSCLGSNGQISLGKQFAGRQVLVEEQEPGIWLVASDSLLKRLRDEHR